VLGDVEPARDGRVRPEDPVTPRYRLVVSAGEYYADTLPRLVVEVLRHRAWHLFRGDGWVD
jgi:hypothetical protein